MAYLHFGAPGSDSLPPFLPLTLLVFGRIAQYVQPLTGCANAARSEAIGIVCDSQKDVGTSISDFLPGGVRGQLDGSPSPPGTLRWMEYVFLSPLCARQILQINQEIRKQPHECPERGSVAHRSDLYK